MQTAITHDSKNGWFAPIAPTTTEINPAIAIWIAPSTAEAEPDLPLNLAIAKTTAFGMINPFIPSVKNRQISKGKNPKSKNPQTSNKIAPTIIAKKAFCKIL